ncbi:uncharacterized protein LOC132738380 [Ruditapes philippinarum]|uniref:uncharacterized protein LOC132738380 n=1 Tax=Ruditapes philippinarum TaxID=129788 RepID=UPI00295B544C|nr:uncharacterized protein LOC132738380 [Ruditapes philippinarum]
MSFKVTIQAIFYVHVIVISATGRDEIKEAASIIFNTLKHLQNDDTGSLTTFNEQLEPSPNIDMNYDTLRTIHGMENSFLTNSEDMKPKRSWEDVSLIWRKSPKRAWEVVNRLWQNPEIRSKYKSYIENGKRSEELVENTPVQQNKETPLWWSEELGNDPVVPIFESNFAEREEQLPESTKRGWETVHPGSWKNKKTSSKRTSVAAMNKRGWEELNWKRIASGVIFKRIPNQGHEIFNFYSNFPKYFDQEFNDKQSLRTRQEIYDNLSPYFLTSKDILTGIMNIKDGHVSYPLHGENSNTDINRDYLETGQSGEVFEPSTFEKLCRLMFKDHAKCRNDAKDDQGPD